MVKQTKDKIERVKKREVYREIGGDKGGGGDYVDNAIEKEKDGQRWEWLSRYNIR